MIIVIAGNNLTGPIIFLLTICKVSLTDTDGCPLVMSKANPLTTLNIIKVITNGAIFKKRIPSPFNKPTKPPIRIVTIIAKISEISSFWTLIIGPNKAVNDIIAPIDISSPESPEIIIAAWPIDARTSIEVVIRILPILFIEMKPSLSICPNINRIILATIPGIYGLFKILLYCLTDTAFFSTSPILFPFL